MLEECHAGIEADYWALGVVLFTLIYGQNPFEAPTEHLAFEKILSLDFKFPVDAQ
jgi:serine/threonine protein kinase